MLYSTNKTLEDKIVETLSHGSKTAKELLKEVESRGEDFSIQGVYKALRKLSEDNIVLKHNRMYILGREWSNRVIKTLGGEVSLPELDIGESVVYKFKELKKHDPYWKHTLSLLKEKYPNYPILFFTSHQMWPYVEGREQSEKDHWDSYHEKNEGYLVIGGDTPLDRLFRKNLGHENFNLDLNPKISMRRNEHLTSVGDHVITTRLDPLLAKKIDQIYESCIDTEKSIEELGQILTGKWTVSLRLENNPSKAKRLRKKLSKNFYIPRELVEKYDLF